MAEKLYNVYVWEWKSSGQSTPAIRIKEGVDVREANDVVDAYLNREDGMWDAYAVEQSDDPGWVESAPHASPNLNDR